MDKYIRLKLSYINMSNNIPPTIPPIPNPIPTDNNNNNNNPRNTTLREAKLDELKRKRRRLPPSMDNTVINLIRECQIMNFGETASLDYIENITTYRINPVKYYKLRKKMALDDSSWFFNFARGGFIHFFRDRMFVFQNHLEKLTLQYSMELSTRPHENQDSERLKWLGEQILRTNVLLAQYGMSSPVIVAMKMAADPQKNFPELDNIANKEEKEKLLLDLGKRFGNYIGRTGTPNGQHNPRTTIPNTNTQSPYPEKTSDDISENISLNMVGEKLGEQQGIRYSEILNDSDETDNTGEISDNQSERENRERAFRKQKEDFVF